MWSFSMNLMSEVSAPIRLIEATVPVEEEILWKPAFFEWIGLIVL